MNIRLYTPVYALTLLLSATLLFSVQPMFSKMVLPLLGGTPQVWNTAMLFFQLMLLGGYAYAHGTSKILGVKSQASLHIILLLVFIVVLPIAIPEGWLPPVDKDPTLWQLSLMSITVGGPFFVLAGSAPMLQRWFSQTDHPDAQNPYFLYGASNLGSMTSLLAYPVIIEPLMSLPEQSSLWSNGYFTLIAFTLIAALLVWKAKPAKSAAHKKPESIEKISWSMRAWWLTLAFIPSSLMLGVTTFITTDIGSAPLLWILPLALYVGTFIIVFARTQIISKERLYLIQGILMIMLIPQLIVMNHNPFVLIGFHFTLFFFCALLCHQRLADLRPSAQHLTEFYLFMSIGGALGGFFNAIIAPNFFTIPVEYALMLVATCFIRYSDLTKNMKLTKAEIITLGLIMVLLTLSLITTPVKLVWILAFGLVICLSFIIDKRYSFAIAIALCLAIYTPGSAHDTSHDIIHRTRNFFGVLKVVDYQNNLRVFLHGTTTHGMQIKDPKYEFEKMSYYGEDSPLQDIFSYYDAQRGVQSIAAFGLGAGTIACYSKDDRHFDFFEINPDVVKIAENPEYFTYLSGCGSPYDVILGDARLTIKDKPDQSYDLIILDAFSSDNIPIHLLTLEALNSYLQKLKPGGTVLAHISNRYLDIEPVLAESAKALDMPGYAKLSVGKEIEGTELSTAASHYFAFTENKALLQRLENNEWNVPFERAGVKAWTDQYSNIISVLGNRSDKKHAKDIKDAAEEKEKAEN